MSIQNIRSMHSVGELMPVLIEQLRVRCAHTPRGEAALDGDMTIEALPTWYAGVTFRSKLESDWAATLDTLGIVWEYEPETITLPSGVKYIPDFRLPELGTWLEVKGTGVPRIEKAIELAETLACRCEGDCTCEWPRGELVLIGHPPLPYSPWSDPDLEHSPHMAKVFAGRKHGGHPNWSAGHGRNPWLARCDRCHKAGWSRNYWCRACDRRLVCGAMYGPGDTGLRFINSDCQPAPERAAA